MGYDPSKLISYTNPGDGPEATPQYFSSARDYYNAMGGDNPAPFATAGYGSGSLLGFNSATRGDYNGDFGYYVDPNSAFGTHPANVGGKPNDSGLWQALSILAPAAGGIFAGLGESGSVGSSAFEGSVPSGESGAVGSSTGSSTLTGGSGTDTLAGGTTDNYFGDYLTDPETGDVISGGASTAPIDDFSTGGTNQGVFSSPSQDGGIDWQQVAQKYGLQGAKALYGLFGGGGGRQTLGQSILGQLGSDPLSAAFSATPFLLALSEANRQGGDINNTIGRMRSLEDSVSGNASPYMNAVLNPYDQQTGTGRASLLQDQQLRGIRGSSFGDQSLNSYDYTRDLGRGDIASKALLGSAGLQGNLMNSELGAINARNTNRNLLLGAGLSASGRLFQPEKDPFNLNTLLGLT
jgi:hypothetical protein